MPTPQNGPAHSNKSLVIADEFFSVFDHFVGLGLNGLIHPMDYFYDNLLEISLLIESKDITW